jgi:hypothetical protein
MLVSTENGDSKPFLPAARNPLELLSAVWNAAGTPESSHVKTQSSSLTKVRDIKVKLIFDLNY